MSTLTTIFSTPPLMVEKYSGDIKTIQEYAESISYHDNQNSYASDNTFVMNDDVFTDLKIFAEECIREYTLNVFNSDHKFAITQSWITKNDFGQTIDIHSHPGSILSGVFYINLPKDSGCIEFNRGKSVFEIQINKDCSNPWMSDRYRVFAETGYLLLFPSNILHSVKMNNVNQTRYSLAFNSFPTIPVGDIDFLTYLY